MKCLFVNSILAASSLLLSVASYGQTSIGSVPFTINSAGTYIVANELVYSGSSGIAITVNVNNVTIDLNGHSLSCHSGNSATGISATNKANVRIMSGEIAGFHVGVYFEYPETGTNLNFGNTVDTVGFYNNLFAVYCYQSTGCTVRNCTIIGGATAIAGIYFIGGTGNRATNNLARGVPYGFYSNGTDYFESNYADHCTLGIGGGLGKLRFNTTTNCTTGVSGGTSELANDQ